VNFLELPPRDAKTGLVNVVIDTPRGSRNKFKYDEDLGTFKLSRVLPEGHVFPFDFGSVPGTRAADGDAIDVMVLLDQPTFAGCLVQVRLIGVLPARQSGFNRARKRKTVVNDRLLGVPQTKVNKPAVRSIAEVDPARIAHIQHFFVSYNEAQGRRFRPGRPLGPNAAEKRLREAIARFEKEG